MSESGAPRKIEGIASTKLFVTEIAIMNTARTIGEVKPSRKPEADISTIAMRFVCMPGVRPVKMPARTPTNKAITISKNIIHLSKIYIGLQHNACMKILFICNQNQNRSRTAAELFRGRFETKSAGLFNEQPVTEKEIAWADTVVVMEDWHRSEIAKRFPNEYMKKRILSLDIPDIYHYHQPELVELLESKVPGLL